MSWLARLVLAVSALALVGGTALAIHTGRNGAPATPVVISPPGPVAAVTTASISRCTLDATSSHTNTTVQVSGACTGSLEGSTTCGDATGSVALGIQTGVGPQRTFSVMVQFDDDPLVPGPTAASLFAELSGPNGFARWSDRSATVRVSADGHIPLDGVRLIPEPGTNASPVVLSGTVVCAAGS